MHRTQTGGMMNRDSEWHLRIDWDAESDRLPIARVRALIERAGHDVKRWERRKSPSTKGWHLRIELRKKPAAMEVVALQLLLGSDPLREASNIRRAKGLRRAPLFWRHRWNVLYTRRRS